MLVLLQSPIETDIPKLTRMLNADLAGSVLIPIVVLTILAAAIIIYVWKKKYEELIEDWEDLHIEMTKSGMASTSTDVYAFVVFLLEVATGKRPVELKTALTGEGLIYLVDLALTNWRKDIILETDDPNLGSEFVVENPWNWLWDLGCFVPILIPECKPSMRRVVQYLSGDLTLQQTDMSALETSDTLNLAFTRCAGPGDQHLFSKDNTKSIPNKSIPSSPV